MSVYMVQPAISFGTTNYKIGMSTSSTMKRLKSYGSNCTIIIARACTNPIDVERELKRAFNAQFRLVEGKEWFSGDITAMISAFDEVLRSHARYVVEGVDEDVVMEDVVMEEPVEDPVMEDVVTEQEDGDQAGAEHEAFYQKYYELINILPAAWFNQRDLLLDITNVIRQERLEDVIKIALMTRLLNERSDSVHSRDATRLLNEPVNSVQARFKLSTLAKIIKKNHPDQYAAWSDRWNTPDRAQSNQSPLAKFLSTHARYKKGSLVKLSEVKALYGKPLVSRELLNVNSEFVVSTHNVCTSCLKKYKRECCKRYRWTARSTCKFIENLELI